MLAAIAIISALTALIAVALYIAERRFRPDTESAIRRVDALLPQTQCEQCGYPGCRPYARAIVAGEAQINLCVPGGEQTIQSLATLLNRPVMPPSPAVANRPPTRVAIIDEQACIGCARCLKACPVDAIVGAARYMHTVVASECTGCDLCVPSCPVDCISMIPVAEDPYTSRIG